MGRNRSVRCGIPLAGHFRERAVGRDDACAHHRPRQFEDLSGNAIIDNVIGPNNLDGDPLDGAIKDDRTTGVLVFSGGTPVQVTVAYNQIFRNHFGIWTSKVVSSTGLRTNPFRHVIAPLSLDH
jgi:hypothetical protein